jgi:hypothetical protein
VVVTLTKMVGAAVACIEVLANEVDDLRAAVEGRDTNPDAA